LIIPNALDCLDVKCVWIMLLKPHIQPEREGDETDIPSIFRDSDLGKRADGA